LQGQEEVREKRGGLGLRGDDAIILRKGRIRVASFRGEKLRKKCREELGTGEGKKNVEPSLGWGENEKRIVSRSPVVSNLASTFQEATKQKCRGNLLEKLPSEKSGNSVSGTRSGKGTSRFEKEKRRSVPMSEKI